MENQRSYFLGSFPWGLLQLFCAKEAAKVMTMEHFRWPASSFPYQANQGSPILALHPKYGSNAPYRDGWWLYRGTEWSQVLVISEIERRTQIFMMPVLRQTGQSFHYNLGVKPSPTRRKLALSGNSISFIFKEIKLLPRWRLKQQFSFYTKYEKTL